MAKLHKNEKALLDAYENDELKPVRGKKAVMEQHKQYAQATLKKDKRLNIRISSRDLNLLQRRALSEGIPYQTLIASVLHKYVEGRLKEH